MSTDHLHCDANLWQHVCAVATPADGELLERVRQTLPLAADVSRSDVMLLVMGPEERIQAVVHAQPHSMASLYSSGQAGRRWEMDEDSWMGSVLVGGQHKQRTEPEVPNRSPEVWEEVWPLLGEDQRPIGAMVIFTNAIERERHRRRDPAFKRSLAYFLRMAAAGQVREAKSLPPFDAQDGIIFIDHAAHYRYLSGQAINLYRYMGYLDDLRERSLEEVAAGDLAIVQAAWESRACVFSEDTVRDRILLRSAIPLLGPPPAQLWQRWRRRLPDHYGALLLVKDETEPRRKAQELKVKQMMIREMHHRVKNNLQMLISIMRMQARRAQTEEANILLAESINRILSIAVIHESLSEGEVQHLHLRSVVQRILLAVQQSMAGSSFALHLTLTEADDVVLPTNKTTACALVLTELLLNALKHGFREGEEGRVWVRLCDLGDRVEMDVEDNGQGLPPGFSIESESSLGLDIIRTLVQDDLKGTFELTSRSEAGTKAVVCFPKGPLGGTV